MGATYLGNGILAPCIFRRYDNKFQKSMINICSVICILVVAPKVYIELPLGTSIFGQWDFDFGSLRIQDL